MPTSNDLAAPLLPTTVAKWDGVTRDFINLNDSTRGRGLRVNELVLECYWSSAGVWLHGQMNKFVH